MASLPIQTTIIGFSDNPQTLMSLYNEDSGVLVISFLKPYIKDTKEGCLLITNDSRLNYDSLFDAAYLRDAIDDYFALKHGIATDGHTARLAIHDRAMQSMPRLEKKETEDVKQSYRQEGLNNAHVATLATCWHVMRRVSAINNSLDLFERLNAAQTQSIQNQLMNGYMVTI